ncbi:MAG: DUF1629 domain-containing protein, partial [Jannaschia sp.]
IFNAGGLYGGTQPVAEILRGLEMGRNGLYPFEYLDQDGETPLPGGPFYFLNVCEMKTAVDVERSGAALQRTGHIRRPSVKAVLYSPGLANGDQVVVASSALHGPDIWMDTQMQQEVFFSDRLVRALRSEKLVKRIEFIQCPVLPASALH